MKANKVVVDARMDWDNYAIFAIGEAGAGVMGIRLAVKIDTWTPLEHGRDCLSR